MGEPWKRYQSTSPQEIGPWSRYQQQPSTGFDKEQTLATLKAGIAQSQQAEGRMNAPLGVLDAGIEELKGAGRVVAGAARQVFTNMSNPIHGAIDMGSSLYGLGKQAAEVPGAVRDLAASPDAIGALGRVAPGAVGEAGATAIMQKAVPAAIQKAPVIASRVGELGAKMSTAPLRTTSVVVAEHLGGMLDNTLAGAITPRLPYAGKMFKKYADLARPSEAAVPAPAGAPVPEPAALAPAPLKAAAPAAQQAEVFKRMGVAAPKASVQVLDELPGGTLSPNPKQTFPGIKSGESAIQHQLTNQRINQLRAIAVQRGIKVLPGDGHITLIRKIMDTVTDAEVGVFETAIAERMQATGIGAPLKSKRSSLKADTETPKPASLTELLKQSVKEAKLEKGK
jgi:hypothetical protein